MQVNQFGSSALRPGRLLFPNLVCCLALGIAAPAQALKAKAQARSDWDRHSVAYTSNDEAIANNYKSKSNGSKWAHGYQYAKWTWSPGHEGSIGSFYSCGFAKAKGWKANFEYRQDVAWNPSGSQGGIEPCQNNMSCDCECVSVVNATTIGSGSGSSSSTGSGSALRIDPSRVLAGGGPVTAMVRYELVERASGVAAQSGEIRLVYDPLSPIGLQAQGTGVFANHGFQVQYTPGGFVVDLAGLVMSTPLPLATHMPTWSGSAIGSSPDAELVLPDTTYFEQPLSSAVALRNSAFRCQAIYDQSHFLNQGATGPIIIRGLRYRAADGVSYPGGATWPNVSVVLASSAFDHAAVTNNFAANRGPDQTLVFNGPVTVQAAEGDAPNDYVVSIPLQTPFVYDPALGQDLLIEIDGGVPAPATVPNFVVANGRSIYRSRRIATNSQTAATGTLTDFAPVCLLDFDGPGGNTAWHRAASENSGAGCYTSGRTVYEWFPSLAAMDLANTTVTMLPTGNGYFVTSGPTSAWHAPTVPGLGLSDDSVVGVTLPFGFPHPGGSTHEVAVCANGFCWLGTAPASGAGDYTPTVAELLSLAPRLCAMWTDLLPDGAVNVDNVFFEVDPTNQSAYLTWVNVPAYANNAVRVNLQIALFADGTVQFRYGSVQGHTTPGLVGYSPGLGAVDTGNRDFSAGWFLSAGPEIAPLSLGATLPLLGTTVLHTIGSLPSGAVLAARLLSFTALPAVDLAPFGAAGCQLLVDTSAGSVDFVPGGGSTAALPLAIPAAAVLLGVQLHGQAAAFVPGVNPLGLLTSNRNTLTLGNQR